MRLALAVLLLVACGSQGPFPSPSKPDTSIDPSDAADAPEAPVALDVVDVPCGGTCGAGTACVAGRCEVVRDVPAVPDVVDATAAEVGADVVTDVALDAGCDASLTNDPVNCGACGRACGAGELCTRGACVANTCRAGYAECDRSSGTVCETSLATDPANCGACERRCASGEVCSRGVCRAACVEGDAMCLGRCVDYATDVLHCGGCGIRCGPVDVCRNGLCIRQ